jgi:hypothetical protein
MMDLQNFADILGAFDWTYPMSDDIMASQTGAAEHRRLRAIARTSIAHQAVYEAYSQWANNAVDGEHVEKPGVPTEPGLALLVEEVMVEIQNIVTHRKAGYVYKARGEQFDILHGIQRVRSNLEMVMHKIET